MEAIRPGMLALSKAGHDREKLYYIVKVDERFVWLSDGKLKPLEAPKKKNLCHIQVIKRGGGGETDRLTNEAVKRIIELYQKERV